MDEKLKTTIKLIAQLSKENPEFYTEICKALGIASTPNTISPSDKRIEQIEKYLGLDYYVDSQQSIIDYSFIMEPEVRAQLISDNREMMRFRYGTRYHSICFDEFCRYAHLQAEMLLNYFFDQVNSNIKAIIDHIKKYNPTALFKDKVKSLGDISYNSKLWAFKAEFSMDYETYSILDNIRRIRNESSHRSLDKEEKSIHDYKKLLVNMGMPLKSNGDVDFYKLEEGSQKMNVYNSMVKNVDWYKDYKYLIWLHEESFEKVINAIEELQLVVKEKTT